MAEIEVAETLIGDVVHPFYTLRQIDWLKWRYTFEGGRIFIEEYLQQFHNEETDDFNNRRNMTHCPAFSKAAVKDVINSITQRFVDITREGGPPSYQEAIKGEIKGVDLVGSSMNHFMATEVIEELTKMGKVGVYVDMPALRGETILDNLGIRPYLYIYKIEDIRSWDYLDSPAPNEYRSLLLRDHIFTRDGKTNLPTGTTIQYRYFFIENNQVYCQFFNSASEPFNPNDITGENVGPIQLRIKKIPFVVIELSNSLLADIADYQISLLNLSSSTLSYAIGNNFPFYVEQFDPRSDSPHLKAAEQFNSEIAEEGPEEGGVTNGQASSSTQTIKVGPGSGRRYAKGLNEPNFINPSAEPLNASLALAEQLKRDIRLLINLSIANLTPKATAAEIKGLDEKNLESGLTVIGKTLEDGERQIAEIWCLYEKFKEIPTVTYPDKYGTIDPKSVWEEVKALQKLMQGSCSITFKRALAKRIVDLVVGHRIPTDQLDKIYTEIDKAKTVDILIEQIVKDVQTGILDPETAANLRGYPEGTAKKAQQFQAERLKLIQMSQTPGQGTGAAAPGARGVHDASPAPAADVQIEKDAAGNPVRGPQN